MSAIDLLTPLAERACRDYYMLKLAKLQSESIHYNASKPFAKARDNRTQLDRLNAIRAYQEIIAELDLPPSERDFRAAYDIESFCKWWMDAHTA